MKDIISLINKRLSELKDVQISDYNVATSSGCGLAGCGGECSGSCDDTCSGSCHYACENNCSDGCSHQNTWL